MYLTLKIGTILYRGINNINNLDISDKPLWLSVDKDSATLYGDQIIEYKLLKDVKLLNIIDSDFHKNYLNILNLIYTGTNFDGVDNRKIEASIPIGLPDFETQYRYLISKNILIQNVTKWTTEHEIANKFLFNLHRYSTFEKDKLFVKTLKYIYGNQCNGYISKLKWPSRLHDGFFNREICLFNPMNDLLFIKKGGKKRNIKKGGGNYEVPEGDSWNRMNKVMDLSDIDEDELFKNTDIAFVLENLDNLIK
jgi:hypothetical protein